MKSMSTRGDLLRRSMEYCADAERSLHDVTQKLQSWGASHDEIESIINSLLAEKFLDESRYVKSYVSEKWNLDRWGKLKIENTLRQKNINDTIIQQALDTIDEFEYEQEMHEVLRKKYKEVKSENKADDARRIMMFAQSRGFEEERIQEWLTKEGFEA